MICTNRSIHFELTSYVVSWCDMILTFTYFQYNFAIFSMWHDMISWYHNMTCTYMHGRCRKRCDHCFSGLPKVAFLSLHFFKARQWTLCNDPLGPEVATPNASAVNASGSDAAARCQRFRLRRGDLLYVPPGWPQQLAHCDTGNQSIEAKLSQNYDMLAIEKMSLPRWVAIFPSFFWICFRSLAWSHCRSCTISAFDTDLAAFDNARTVAGWFTWRVTQWPPNRPLQLKMLEGLDFTVYLPALYFIMLKKNNI